MTASERDSPRVLLRASGLSKTFVIARDPIGRARRRLLAVKSVDLDVAPGETLGVVGESGAGKSTVGRMLLRLIEPDGGTLWFKSDDALAYKGRELRRFRARARMIFQDPFSSLDPTMSIGDAVAEPMQVHAIKPRREIHDQVAELLKQVGLGAHQIDRRPHEFSGGQLQRVAVARAIATMPDLIVCDEPVAALDMSIRAQVINLLLDLQAERGMAYVFISHDLSLVGHIAHRVAVMYRGRVVESGDCAELMSEPRHPYTRALLASVPVVDPDRRRQQADSVSRPASGSQLDLPGCDYTDRCPYARPVCSEETPTLRTVGGVRVACHLYDQTPLSDGSEGGSIDTVVKLS